MGRYTNKIDGFTLPTVLLASVLMLAVLATALQLVSATSASLRDQYYNQLAREAAEAGVLHAQECLESNDYDANWTNAKPLRPNTDCAGTVINGRVAYLASSMNVQTSYTVVPPVKNADSQRLSVTGIVQLTQSGGGVTKSYTTTNAAHIGAVVSFDRVTFGYMSDYGSFFSVMYPSGKVMSTGYNGFGQHGNGRYSSSLVPSQYGLPAGESATSVYTSFLSSGSRLFVATDKGNLYGSGYNSSGQLGNGATSTRTIPVKFILSAGVSAKSVSLLQDTTFVIGSDYNVYAAGACAEGILGNNYTIAGCSNQSTPVRVALPAVNTANANTLPVLSSSSATQPDNIVSDGKNAYVRMQGGAVYGWGQNSRGQLGNGTTTGSSVPVKIGTFGNSGAPRATQIATDGEVLYILDNQGNVWVTGSNIWSALAGAAAKIKNYGSNGSNGLCIDSVSATATVGTRVRTVACSSSGAQLIEFVPVPATLPSNRGLLRVASSGSPGRCIDNQNNSTTNTNPIILSACNESQMSQLWRYGRNSEDWDLFHPSTSKCMDKPATNNLQLYDCNGTAAQWWILQDILTPTKVPLPSGLTARKVATDQSSVLILMSDGSVWGAGTNNYGQLGNRDGTAKQFNPALRKYMLPSAAKDIYTTRFAETANTFAVLTDGRVYGSGRNNYGQLGIGTISTTNQFTPVAMQLPSGVNAVTVQTGLGTTAILTSTGKIYTVGNNSYGQLGDGTRTNSGTPSINKFVNDIPVLVY